MIFNYFAFTIKNKTKTLFFHLANCTPVVHSFRIRKARKFENRVAFARGLDFSKCQRVVGLLFTLLPLVKAEPRHLGFETSFDRHLGSQQQLRQQQHVLLLRLLWPTFVVQAVSRWHWPWEASKSLLLVYFALQNQRRSLFWSEKFKAFRRARVFFFSKKGHRFHEWTRWGYKAETKNI